MRLTQDAAERDSFRDAHELDRDLRLDRTVEPNLVEVDVGHCRADRVELVVLQHGVMSLLLAAHNDVEDLVHPVLSAKRLAQLPLTDRERARLAGAVENAGHESLTTQTPRLPAPTGLALRHLEPDSLPSHTGRKV